MNRTFTRLFLQRAHPCLDFGCGRRLAIGVVLGVLPTEHILVGFGIVGLTLKRFG